MSDEDTLGEACCLPRKIYVLILAIGFLLYGTYNALYFIIAGYIEMFKMEPSRCSGPHCDGVLSCEGTREASYHFRICVLAIGSLVFGITGINAIYNKYASDMFSFAGWLLVLAVVHSSVWLMDTVYTATCGSVFSYNTIMETILWPTRGLPVHSGVKYEINQLNVYDVNYVNAIIWRNSAGDLLHNVATWYFLMTALRVLFWLFSAYQAFVLAQRFHYGIAGMGATFSLEGWRKRLNMRYEIKEAAYNTFDMGWATGMDLGWTEDEFRLQRPLRTGYMPGAAAQAYDGFQDDRRNVLL